MYIGAGKGRKQCWRQHGKPRAGGTVSSLITGFRWTLVARIPLDRMLYYI